MSLITYLLEVKFRSLLAYGTQDGMITVERSRVRDLVSGTIKAS